MILDSFFAGFSFCFSDKKRKNKEPKCVKESFVLIHLLFGCFPCCLTQTVTVDGGSFDD